MPANGGGPRWLWTVALLAVDALAYALVVTAGTLTLAVVAGVALGGGFVPAKFISFLAGWLLLAVATVRLWPTSPTADDTPVVVTHARTSGGFEPTRIEAIANALPPLRWMQPPVKRLSPPTKLFLASLVVLLASFALEAIFAVG